MKKRPVSIAAATLVLLLLQGAALSAFSASSGKTNASLDGPQPFAIIPLEPLGFEPPSLFYLPERRSELTLSFLDATHLLFTFRINGLVRRTPDSHAGDEDQLIRADVLDISTGKVIQQAQWILHDHYRYLWMLRGGKFLIRKRNTLYISDRSLQLHLWNKSPLPLLYVAVSPDRKLIAIERQEPADIPSLAPSIDLEGHLLDRPRRVGITVYRTVNGKTFFTTVSPRPLALALVQNGFLQLLQGQRNSQWVVRRISIASSAGNGPAQVTHQDILTLTSKCPPSLLSLSNTVVIAGCTGDGQDHLMTALNLHGQVLWNQWWQSRYLWHTIAYAEDGSRFALGSLLTDHPYTSVASIDPQSIEEQIVGVFDTRTGHLTLVRNAEPIVSAGQNFALSADGSEFAILRGQAIQIYRLPPIPQLPPP